jgi:hypothetical protein
MFGSNSRGIKIDYGDVEYMFRCFRVELIRPQESIQLKMINCSF